MKILIYILTYVILVIAVSASVVKFAKAGNLVTMPASGVLAVQ